MATSRASKLEPGGKPGKRPTRISLLVIMLTFYGSREACSLDAIHA